MKNIFMERHHSLLEDSFGDHIHQFLNEKTITEIMVNSDGKLWIESHEGKRNTGIVLPSYQVETIVQLVANFRGSIANDIEPEVSFELPKTGSRFQGYLPPIVTHPCFTIQKKSIKIFTIEEYVSQNFMTKSHAYFLKKAIASKKNIIIAGGSASGKTTLLNALLNELVLTNERVVILEDLPEIQTNIQDKIILRTTPEKTMRQLIQGILRMRPDRIIIGEVRDGSAHELLKAWNTGHPGGLCTLHANRPESTLGRLEDLILEALPSLPNHLIPESIHGIVFMKKKSPGQFHVSSIHSVKEGKLIPFES